MTTGISSLVGLVCGLLLISASLPTAFAEPAPPLGETVAEEEYRIYDEVVRSKFLTTGTVLVVIERMTTNRLLPPDPERPELTTRALFETQELFDSRLPQELVTDFLLTNHKPARLASRFAFGVPYRFRSSSGEPESDVFVPDGGLSVRPVRLIQDAQTIDRLSFSRVGFAPRREQALVYVANDRPDGNGAGFLVWLRSRDSFWHILDTEVVWTARTQRDSPELHELPNRLQDGSIKVPPDTWTSGMIRKTFPVPPLGCNCSIIGDPVTKQAVVVDPGGASEHILREVAQLGLTVVSILHTHAHFDHFLASGEMKKATGAALCLHPDDRELWDILEVQCRMFGVAYVPVPAPDYWLKDEEKLIIGSLEGRALHTPGHTPGSMCFHFPSAHVVLAGDTIFRGAIGRTDLWGGDYNAIERSIRERLYTLSEDTAVVTGHGPETLIGVERKGNPYVRA